LNLPLDDCFFGVPQSEYFGWTVMDAIPKELKGIHFYLGGEPEELISAFALSEYPQSLERLDIGNSSYAIGRNQDYRALISTIENTEFPNLKQLELGIWEQFCNAHSMYGKLGDVTKLVTNCPLVSKLGLYGCFELNRSLRLSSLKDITVTLDDFTTGSNGGFISQATLSNLLDSYFPTLEQASLDLNCEEDQNGYIFSDLFLAGKNMPRLKRLEIAGGFLRGEKERLLESPICRRRDITFFLDDMSVS
jgi:hypothetical protein